ncbi:DUF7146 domain-containing protein [Kaistia adipata]|uniref:DUF7146 domain-containing protein n=1 Tax=Kaistia adipata TaxID=166954 RepID=UPI000491BE26|nr:toprim domain-containing protein [Kaistia adipata]
MQGFPLNAREVAAALGGEVTGRNSVSAPGPGHSRADRSLSIMIDPRAPGGFVVTSFAGDDPLECKDHVRGRLGLEEWRPTRKDDAAPIDFVNRMEERVRKSGDSATEPASNPDQGNDRLFPIATRMWDEATSIKDSLAETYLRTRGLWLPSVIIAGGQLRFHPSCTFKLGDGSRLNAPAMLALMTDAETGEPRAVHRTALSPEGGKLDDPRLGNPKKMLGRARGAVVRLCPNQGPALGIAEGIENAVAAVCGGLGAVWAAGMAANLQSLPVLAGIETLRILADVGAAGEKAASECGGRWVDAGRQVEALYPKTGDWNDMMKGVL